MREHVRSPWFRTQTAAALAVTVALTGAGCARSLSRPETPASPTEVQSLWRDPADIRTRDLFHGAGGSHLAPGPGPFAFVERKSVGTNPGYDVRDREGVVWSVKLGPEAQSEVALSRVLWALGFHQPPTYYLPRWQMTGEVNGEQPAGRFRPELPGHEVVDDWSWYDNPFIGTRQFAALVTVNLLFNNWDLKTPNNKIYDVKTSRGVERRYVVRDLGGSLGSAMQPAALSWIPFMRWMQGSRNDLADFEEQRFIDGVDGGRVEFEYRGLDAALVDSVTVEDLRWTVALLSRLSERQWLDAFRAAGYTEDERRRYVAKIQSKIAEARQAAGPAPSD
jgi:hypothetical protein